MAYREPKMTTYLAHFMIEQLTDKKCHSVNAFWVEFVRVSQ